MKKKIIQFGIAFLLISNLAIWATGTTYIYKALLHLQANIDDLNIFEFRAVSNRRPSKNPTEFLNFGAELRC
jgi:hypothetical protein